MEKKRDVYILISMKTEPVGLPVTLANAYKTTLHRNPEYNIKFNVVSIPAMGTYSLPGRP
jgi:hypothetical protein